MLELRHVTSGYGQHIVLDDLNLTFHENELTMILGPNGAGKSTLLNIAGGWRKPQKGQVLLNQEDLAHCPPAKLAEKTGRMEQVFHDALMPVERFVLLGRFHASSLTGGYTQEDRKAARKAIREMDIEALQHQGMDTLSTGQRQKAAMAQVLAQNPQVFLLDEPGSALDPYARFELLDLFQKLRRADRILIVIIHDLDLALRYADRIVLLEEGKVRFVGSPLELIESGKLEEVFKLRLEDWDPISRTGRILPLGYHQ